jgi:hypothetical protein
MTRVSQFIGSGLIPLETIEVTGSTLTVEFTNGIDDTFNNYKLIITNVTTSSTLTSTFQISCRVGNATVGYISSLVYDNDIPSISSGLNGTATNDSEATLCQYIGRNGFAVESTNIEVDFFNLRNSRSKSIIARDNTNLAGQSYAYHFVNNVETTELIDRIQINSPLVLVTGKFTLYGIKEP